jgi:uncharacterized protein YjbJ (UPF0337 family)
MVGPKPGHDHFAASEFAGTPSRTGALLFQRGGGRSVRLTRFDECGGSAMNWDQLEGNWTKAKGKLRQQWGKLTDDDVDVINGKREELAGRLQARYGYQKEQAEKAIDEWMKKAS